MIKTYLKIAWRNLLKNKTAAGINIFGLSVGLASCMLILLYIVHETSYDKFHKNAGEIYLVGTTFIKEGKESNTAGTPVMMGEMMRQEFPEVQASARLMGLFAEDKTLLRNDADKGAPKTFYEERGFLADSGFFQLFTYAFKEGNPATALTNARSIVLSEDIAIKLFGSQPALNKTVHVSSNTNGGDADCVVTGVFKPINKPSHIDARFFISFRGSGMEDYFSKQGNSFATNNMFLTYLLLKPGSDAKKLQAKFPAFMSKYAAKDLKAAGFDKRQFLTGLKDVHLKSGIDVTVTPSGSTTYLYILASIAAFILIIACINFMNLATARSSKRSAEVGVRKVLGAEKAALIKQFLGESLLIALIAFVVAIAVAKMLLPVFSSVSGKSLSLSFTGDILLVAGFFLLSLITGLLAGSYPAFYLSSFKPVKVLKGRFSNSLAAVSLRKGLVVFQFVISVALIIASIVIQKQMSFLRSKDLGFVKDQQLVIPLRSETAKAGFASLKNEISKSPDVQSVGASVYYPGIFNPEDNNFYRQGQDVNQAKHTRTNRVDDNFLQTLGIQLVAGRLFSAQFTADTGRTIIINEKAVAEIGFVSPQQAIGQKIFFDFQGKTIDYIVVGVVKDFHFEDLQQPITPYAFTLDKHPDYNYLVVHGNGKNLKAAIASIEKDWKSVIPNEPFEYSFLDADFQKNYLAQERLSSIVGYFTIIGILICCLGLFGLATFSAEQRIKEIGVRKVLGASVGGIVTLLSKDFLKLVIIAALIASPLSWYVMNEWLKNFAYRTDIGWMVFAVTIVAAVLIALVTIGIQAFRAALSNPVKSLRTE